MLIDILSLFPEYFQSPFEVSMIKRAKEKGILQIRLTNIRDFAEGKHRRVDDRPFGGGPGMVLMPEPLAKAIRSRREEDSHVVHLSPQGSLLNVKTCKRLALKKHLIFVCGHYEGVDERIIEKEIDEEISIGDYVLTNGCIAAIVVIDALMRFVDGVLGNEEAASKDSFEQGIFDFPQYTKPEVFEGTCVPPILKSGDHARIEEWRRKKAIEKTRKIRPDLMKGEEKR